MEQSHGILTEECHIFSKHECEVVHVVLLMEHNVVTQLLSEPSDLFRSRQAIHISREKRRRDAEVFDWHERYLSLSVDFLVLKRPIVVPCELTSIYCHL